MLTFVFGLEPPSGDEVEVRARSATVGEALTARQMANLFQRKISGVVKSLCECAEIKTANEQSVHQRTGC